MTRSTQHDRFANLLFYALILLLGYLAYLVFLPFFAPLAWAGVIVVVCYPVAQTSRAALGKDEGLRCQHVCCDLPVDSPCDGPRSDVRA